MRRRLNIFFLILLVAVLGGCGGSTVAPVSERGVPSSRNHPPAGIPGEGRAYRVKPGDTLYSIAFRFGRDYRELAALNHISPPYTIYVGQRLRVSPTAQRRLAAPRPASPAAPAPAATAPAAPAAPAASAAVAAPTPARKPVPPVAKGAPRPAAPPPAPAPHGGPPRWRWPADGQLLTRFDESSAGRKGIDIGGSLGQPVHAAADGVVVYSGSGLRGYGELIIVKHNNNYLSAYAHNKRLLAKEGDDLKAGDVLAEMGRSETDRVMLHFEIRHDGKPVDPMRYLPSR